MRISTFRRRYPSLTSKLWSDTNIEFLKPINNLGTSPKSLSSGRERPLWVEGGHCLFAIATF